MSTRDVGRAGEGIAAKYLEKQGAAIIARNFTVRGGEIDLIAEKDDIVHFVEVKLRNNLAFGRGAEAVTKEKQRRICRAAVRFLAQRGWQERFCRFDVIEICPPDELRYIERAFDYVK